MHPMFLAKLKPQADPRADGTVPLHGRRRTPPSSSARYVNPPIETYAAEPHDRHRGRTRASAAAAPKHASPARCMMASCRIEAAPASRRAQRRSGGMFSSLFGVEHRRSCSRRRREASAAAAPPRPPRRTRAEARRAAAVAQAAPTRRSREPPAQPHAEAGRPPHGRQPAPTPARQSAGERRKPDERRRSRRCRPAISTAAGARSAK